MEAHDRREARRAMWMLILKFAILAALLIVVPVLPFMSWEARP